MNIDIQKGRPEPLGAIYDGRGVNFAVLTALADNVELCLFDEKGKEQCIELPGKTDDCRHGYAAGLKPGQLYGFRVHGPWDPSAGHLCHPSKLLLDPCARAVSGSFDWHDALFPFRDGNHDEGANQQDSAPHAARSVVIDSGFDWEQDQCPDIPLADTIIYETHVKGFTFLRPEVPEELRGTYAAIAHESTIDYLVDLGINAIELLPVYQFVHRKRLVEMSLRNYWGYDPVCFFAPHNEYASVTDPSEQVSEFKQMVKALHAAGLEIILDVVYNHTGEGGREGPVLMFKGLDNAAYYHLDPDRPTRYLDYTGTHNTLDASNPLMHRTIIDSLRYWAEEMHVDGFRFDVAAAFLRKDGEIRDEVPILREIREDSVLRHVKLFAEPWDATSEGYRLGRFPAGWSEWNDRYRDSVRKRWHGQPEISRTFMMSFAGSPDLFRKDDRKPPSSVNMVTCHDGATLRDLVTYEGKYNQANREDNRDGADDNFAWNAGHEGETDDDVIQRTRSIQQRNLLATLFLSRGVPLLLGGDEIGRTQDGNNNAYCQDNRTSWYEWQKTDHALRAFVQDMIRIRRQNSIFRPNYWPDDNECGSIQWFTSDGSALRELEEPSDHPPDQPAGLTAWIRGGDSEHFMLLLNPSSQPIVFRLPDHDGLKWTCLLDTSQLTVRVGSLSNDADGLIPVIPHSMILLAGRPQDDSS